MKKLFLISTVLIFMLISSIFVYSAITSGLQGPQNPANSPKPQECGGATITPTSSIVNLVPDPKKQFEASDVALQFAGNVPGASQFMGAYNAIGYYAIAVASPTAILTGKLKEEIMGQAFNTVSKAYPAVADMYGKIQTVQGQFQGVTDKSEAIISFAKNTDGSVNKDSSVKVDCEGNTEYKNIKVADNKKLDVGVCERTNAECKVQATGGQVSSYAVGSDGKPAPCKKDERCNAVVEFTPTSASSAISYCNRESNKFLTDYQTGNTKYFGDDAWRLNEGYCNKPNAGQGSSENTISGLDPKYANTKVKIKTYEVTETDKNTGKTMKIKQSEIDSIVGKVADEKDGEKSITLQVGEQRIALLPGTEFEMTAPERDKDGKVIDGKDAKLVIKNIDPKHPISTTVRLADTTNEKGEITKKGQEATITSGSECKQPPCSLTIQGSKISGQAFAIGTGGNKLNAQTIGGQSEYFARDANVEFSKEGLTINHGKMVLGDKDKKLTFTTTAISDNKYSDAQIFIPNKDSSITDPTAQLQSIEKETLKDKSLNKKNVIFQNEAGVVLSSKRYDKESSSSMGVYAQDDTTGMKNVYLSTVNGGEIKLTYPTTTEKNCNNGKSTCATINMVVPEGSDNKLNYGFIESGKNRVNMDGGDLVLTKDSTSKNKNFPFITTQKTENEGEFYMAVDENGLTEITKEKPAPKAPAKPKAAPPANKQPADRTPVADKSKLPDSTPDNKKTTSTISSMEEYDALVKTQEGLVYVCGAKNERNCKADVFKQQQDQDLAIKSYSKNLEVLEEQTKEIEKLKANKKYYEGQVRVFGANTPQAKASEDEIKKLDKSIEAMNNNKGTLLAKVGYQTPTPTAVIVTGKTTSGSTSTASAPIRETRGIL